MFIAHSATPTLFERLFDLALATTTVFASVMIFRYSKRVWRNMIDEASPTENVLKLISVSCFIGFCGVARIAEVYMDWHRTAQLYFFHYDMYAFRFTIIPIFWVITPISVGLIGIAAAFWSLNARSIIGSKSGKALIRLKLPIIIVASLTVIGGYLLQLNLPLFARQEGLVDQIKELGAYDAYINPSEIKLYTISYRETGPPPPPPSTLEGLPEYRANLADEKEWARISSLFRGYEIEKNIRTFEPEFVHKKFKEINIFPGYYSNWYGNSAYLLRFIGENSVLDIWLSDAKEIELYSNETISDIPHILGFKKPYDEVMRHPAGGSVRYYTTSDHWLHELIDGAKD